MKKLVREPLVHFLMLGAALFGVHWTLNRGRIAPPDEIVVTSGQIESLAIGFTRVWQRPPTDTELKGLIDYFVKEEIMCREAVKLGLDQNDSVIRRRLQQKMDIITDDFASSSEPTEAELADYLARHPATFAQDQRYTFRQVYLNREKRGDHLDADATSLLTMLRQQPLAEIGEFGDELLLPREFASEAQGDVAAQLGQKFATALANVEVGQWSGPIQSEYGVHLVLVTQRTSRRLPALAEVRDQVKRQFIDSRRAGANQQFFDNLLAKYHVAVQPFSPRPAGALGKVAVTR